LTEVVVTPGYLDRFHLSTKQAAFVLGTRVEVGFPRGFATGAARARWIRPTVVGVAAQDAGPGQVLGSVELAAVGRDWTLAGGPRGAQRFGLQDTTYTGLFVIADRLDRVTPVRTRITAVGFATSAPENLIASVKRYLRVVDIVLAAVSVIALSSPPSASPTPCTPPSGNGGERSACSKRSAPGTVTCCGSSSLRRSSSARAAA